MLLSLLTEDYTAAVYADRLREARRVPVSTRRLAMPDRVT